MSDEITPWFGRGILVKVDAWVVRAVLDPSSPLFREARYLLSEEPDLRDGALYSSVLDAIASGASTRGGIASHIGRSSADLAHVLTVLVDAGLLRGGPGQPTPVSGVLGA